LQKSDPFHAGHGRGVEMDKDSVRFWSGAGLTVIGLGENVIAPMLPHWIGWLLIAVGLGIMAWPLLRRGKKREISPPKPSKEEIQTKNCRRLRIADARASITVAFQRRTDNEVYRRRLEPEASYIELRPHLSDAFKQMMTPTPNIVAVCADGGPTPKLAVAYRDELERLEKLWGLQ
jgi:hypothetical protein